MSHFAKIESGVVTQVIVAEQDFINSGAVGDPTQWYQTSYNTRGGVHELGGTPYRKNYAGVGYSYDADKDAFIPPQPYPSWTLNETSCLWEPPVARPDDDNRYEWNEADQSWTLLT